MVTSLSLPFICVALITSAIAHCAGAATREALDIGSRRELWVDQVLVGELKGHAELRLHRPEPQEVALSHHEPWEGNASGYHSVFQDGALYRMYYRGWQITFTPGKASTSNNFLCYAESDDGIRWRKPNLGLHEFKGSKANNIVLLSGKFQGVDVDAGHPAVFRDDNPAAKPAERYKAIIRSKKPLGLLAYGSSDGIRWAPIQTAPVITDGAFDSQNLAFWDESRGEYRAYWRYFTAGVTSNEHWKPEGIRAIRTATSRDFVHWENQADLRYDDAASQQLYTNVVRPYHRAPHLYVGFPQRYLERGWSESMRVLPDREHRELRAGVVERYGTALSEIMLMASRDGVSFHRWSEAFMRPGIEREGTWNYPHLLSAWHLVETQSPLPGAPNELSIYAVEGYGMGSGNLLRRYTLRLDGFVSASAPASGGELITKSIKFRGNRLVLNFATSAAGSVRIEIQDASGKPLPGFALSDCPPMFGDTVERRVTWNAGGDVSALSAQPVRLRFVLNDADVYAFQFKNEFR